MSKLDVNDAILVVVDFQEKILPAMKNNEEIAKKTAKLIEGCRTLGVPIIATQQYTKGLGETVGEIKDALTRPIGDDIPSIEFKHVEKKSFSCMDEPNFREALIKSGREQVIVCGIESHVCVQQTAIDMFEYGDEAEFEEDEYEFNGEDDNDNVVIYIDGIESEGELAESEFEVFLACDCVGSRYDYDKETALKRMSDLGIEMMTMESALFEMTRGAENPKFRQISKIVK